jgi:hypothetical protein
MKENLTEFQEEKTNLGDFNSLAVLINISNRQQGEN